MLQSSIIHLALASTMSGDLIAFGLFWDNLNSMKQSQKNPFKNFKILASNATLSIVFSIILGHLWFRLAGVNISVKNVACKYDLILSGVYYYNMGEHQFSYFTDI